MLYLMAGIPTRGAVPDHVLNVLDIAVAFRALSQHDGRAFCFVDVAGCQKWRRDAIQLTPYFVQRSFNCERSSNGIESLFGGVCGITADVLYTVAREKLETRFRGGAALTADLHQSFRRLPTLRV